MIQIIIYAAYFYRWQHCFVNWIKRDGKKHISDTHYLVAPAGELPLYIGCTCGKCWFGKKKKNPKNQRVLKTWLT